MHFEMNIKMHFYEAGIRSNTDVDGAQKSEQD